MNFFLFGLHPADGFDSLHKFSIFSRFLPSGKRVTETVTELASRKKFQGKLNEQMDGDVFGPAIMTIPRLLPETYPEFSPMLG